MKGRSVPWLVVCSLVSAAFGQETPAALDPLLQQAIESRKKTTDEAQKYTYTEHLKNENFDSNGIAKQHFTDTFEIIFLEGAPYKKHTLHNELPLSSKEQKREDKKLADVAKARLERKTAGLFHASFQFEFPLDQLATSFNITLNGSEDIDGRRNLVFTAVPRASDADGLKQAARAGAAYEIKLWVDQQDGVFTKIEGKVVATGMRYENGTLIIYQFKKVNGEAWLPERFWFKGKVRYMRTDVPVEAEQTYSDYKKFSAETKLVTQ